MAQRLPGLYLTDIIQSPVKMALDTNCKQKSALCLLFGFTASSPTTAKLGEDTSRIKLPSLIQLYTLQVLWTSCPHSSFSPRKYVSPFLDLLHPCFFVFSPIPFPTSGLLAVVSAPVHLLRARWLGGLSRPRVWTCSQGPSTWHMAAGTRGKQSERDWHPSLHWTVVPAGASTEQQSDTRNTTTGKNKF